MAEASIKTLHHSLDKLDISKSSQQAKPKAAEPVDSWEDDAGSDTETEVESKAALRPTSTSASDVPSPPPPTPISPSIASARDNPHTSLPSSGYDGTISSNSSSGANTPSRRVAATGSEDKRPEKSTAVASRLIAAGLGQKAPKRTKEQREYDQAMKVQEKKKRDAARDEEKRKAEETEKAKRDIWGD